MQADNKRTYSLLTELTEVVCSRIYISASRQSEPICSSGGKGSGRGSALTYAIRTISLALPYLLALKQMSANAIAWPLRNFKRRSERTRNFALKAARLYLALPGCQLEYL